MKFIQVAGTNAKGSVCTYAAEILTRAGYRCGLFTSPHLIRREERIRIDGEEIPTRELDRLMRENPGKTLFHTYLNACMKWFAENGVQVAVMETGLGGRIDPVSELPVDVVVLTPIGIDHAEVLGDTVEKIALEKCRTVRQNGYVVCAPQQEAVRKIIETTCDLARARLVALAWEDIGREADGKFSFRQHGGLCVRGIGPSQPMDAALAIAAVRGLSHVGIYVDERSVREGIARANIPGRMQYLPRLDMLIDGGHNEGAFCELERTLDQRFPKREKVLLCAAMKEKDISYLADMAQRQNIRVFATQLNMERARSADELGTLFKSCEAIKNTKEALLRAQKTAQKNNALLIVAGSFYLAGEVLALIGE